MKWTPPKVKTLEDIAGTMTVENVAKYLETTVPSVQRAAAKRGISLSYIGRGSNRRTVTDDVVKAVRYDLENSNYTRKELAALYGLTENYVGKLANDEIRTKPYRKPPPKDPHTDLLNGVFS